MKKLSDNLALLRKSHGYRQKDVADRIDLSKQTYAAYEQGRAEPDCETLVRLARLYGLSLDALFGEEERNNVTLSNEQIDKIIRASSSIDEIGRTLREVLGSISRNGNNVEINGDNNCVNINSGNKGGKEDE